MLGLSSWIGGLLGPAIDSYRNQQTRISIKKKIPQLVRLGSLPELFNLIDNNDLRKQDQEDYVEAKIKWLAAEKEIEEIEILRNDRAAEGEDSSKQAVAMISIGLGLIFVTLLMILQVL